MPYTGRVISSTVLFVCDMKNDKVDEFGEQIVEQYMVLPSLFVNSNA